MTAGRLKRMKSIRRKLSRENWSLVQIQDIAGCRAILGSMEAVSNASIWFQEQTCHRFVKIDDHIAQPKQDGYRSVHLVYRSVAEAGDAEGALVEVQLRTRLQHAWATAVEAVGLVRGEDLKGGSGSADWRRLFALMAAEFAEEEGAEPVPGMPTCEGERAKEIAGLERRLEAETNLDSYRRIIDRTAALSRSTGQVFLVQYDNSTRTVNARTYGSFASGSRELEAAERGSRSVDSVLVEVDRAADLRAAYPNYYLDVGLFSQRLSRVLRRRQLAGRTPRRFDFSWLDRWRG